MMDIKEIEREVDGLIKADKSTESILMDDILMLKEMKITNRLLVEIIKLNKMGVKNG